jgi:hypothetical protein
LGFRLGLVLEMLEGFTATRVVVGPAGPLGRKLTDALVGVCEERCRPANGTRLSARRITDAVANLLVSLCVYKHPPVNSFWD